MLTVRPPIYLLEGTVPCDRCNANASVVAIASTEMIEDGERVQSGDDEEGLFVLTDIRSLPERLLRAIQASCRTFAPNPSNNPSTRTFTNHCACGATLSDHEIFCTPDQGFLPSDERAISSTIHISRLPCEDGFESDAMWGMSSVYDELLAGYLRSANIDKNSAHPTNPL